MPSHPTCSLATDAGGRRSASRARTGARAIAAPAVARAMLAGGTIGRGRGWRVAALLGAFAVAACTIERHEGADSSMAAGVLANSAPADTVLAQAVESTSTPAATNGVADSGAPAVAPVVPTASMPGDTLPLVATAAELDALAANLVIPVQGVGAGDLRDTYDEARGERVHEALDILAPRNTPVVAATDGRVLELHQSVAGGLMVYAADASDRFVMMYGHLEAYAPGLAKGQPLRQGQVIGYVGTSGNAPVNTPHLHFVISRGRPSISWWRGTPVNPHPLLARAGAR